MPWEPVNLVLTVVTSGTKVPLSATRLLTKSFIIEAGSGNTGSLKVGDSTVSPTRGQSLSKGEVFGVSIEESREYVDLSKWFIDSTKNGETAEIQFLSKI